MYVIRNKDGKFWRFNGGWLKNIISADHWDTLKEAREMLNAGFQPGDAIYKVEMKLGKKVK